MGGGCMSEWMMVSLGWGGKDHTDAVCTGRAKVKPKAKVWREMRQELTAKCEQPVKAEPAVWRSKLITDLPKTIICDSLLWIPKGLLNTRYGCFVLVCSPSSLCPPRLVFCALCAFILPGTVEMLSTHRGEPAGAAQLWNLICDLISRWKLRKLPYHWYFVKKSECYKFGG